MNIFNRCDNAVEQMKKDEKKKKGDERTKLFSMKNFRELEAALRSVTIDS